VGTNANPISSLDNYIAASAFIFYPIAKRICDRGMCNDYGSQRFARRGYVDNDWLTEIIFSIIPSVRCEINFNPVHFPSL